MAQQIIDTVVFDLGGVLVDFDPRLLYRDLFKGDEAAMQDFLTRVCTREWHERHDAGISFADNAAPLAQQYPQLREMIEAWGNRFGDMLEPKLDSLDLAAMLKRNGVDLYALTNWPAEAFIPARARFGFDALFTQIVVSGKVKLMKPDPAIYKLLIARTGINPKHALYIDDRAENLPPAEQLGFTTVQFTTAEALAAKLRDYNLLPLKECA